LIKIATHLLYITDREFCNDDLKTNADEYDETTDEEEGNIDDTDDFDENQQMHIYNRLMLEEMEDIIEWID
jgi:hypothetical protein